MTQIRKQTAVDGRRLRPPTVRQWHLLAAFVVLSALQPLPSQAHNPIPPVDAESIYRRLEQQDAEIQWLRSRLSEVRALMVARPADAVAPAFHKSQSQDAEFAANGLDELKSRLAAVDEAQAKAKPAKSAGDGGLDVSNSSTSACR